ncbi:spore germination protein [Thermoactinomyces sp. CICC 10522]|uniref:spore germination protein n=1 Tax=Thermoactinomyces sp. CICC 10522 TaxID=2767427 RepID=UPI0018DE58D9|nr:spore germination protein [Thermoactinomyces sp. CICC 10522]MBH8605389.1 spore germination protein [Thermoactinomyces sp. CICC 10522]
MSFFKSIFSNNRYGNHKSKKNTLKGEKKPFKSLEDNIRYIKEAVYNTDDLKEREVDFCNRKAILLYMEPMCSHQKLYDYLIDPIQRTIKEDLEEVILSPELEIAEDLNHAIFKLLDGSCVILLEREKRIYIANVPNTDKRGIEEPDNERVVRGPHYGYVEDLSTNLRLLRKQIQNPNLVIRYYKLGKITRNKIAVAYMHNLANPELVDKVDQRLRSISSDTILSPGFLQEYIEDHPFSPFPQVLNTERPDRTMAALMEGKVAIFSEADPTALIVPVTLFTFYQTPDDYHSRWIVGSFVRLIRLSAFLISFILPAAYIAIVSYHPEVLPVDLAYNIQGTLQNIPFPPLLEALLMELTVELIREAGIRLPSPVGQTIGIVGGLVIGDAVVHAGYVSYTMVLVVAVTAISSFLVPSNDMSTSIRVLRFPLMFVASVFGAIGILFGVMFLLIHLAKLDSFGTPYMAPAMPFRLRDMKDTFVRLPIWKFNERPQEAHPQILRQEWNSREWENNEEQH